MKPSFLSLGTLLLGTLGVLADVSSATAGPLRYAIVLDEHLVVAGTPGHSERNDVAGALGEMLLGRGAVLVDAAQTRALRKSLGPDLVRAAESGEALGPVTSADADLLVTGTVLGSIDQPMGMKVYGCHLGAQLRVVAVDSGEVVQAVSGEVMERDFAAEQAFRLAARALAGKLAAQLGVKASARRLEIHVKTPTPTDVRIVERVLRAAESLDGVVEARMLSSNRKEALIEVVARGTDARALALDLARRPETGLRVWGYSNRVVRAELEPAQAMSLLVVPMEFKGSGPSTARLLPTALGTALAAKDGFEVDRTPRLPSRRERRALAQRLSRRPKEALLLDGESRRKGDALTVSARLVRARGNKVVARGTADCQDTDLTRCMTELAERMRPRALLSMSDHLGEAGGADSLSRPLQMVGLSSSDIFPISAVAAGQDPQGHREEWVELHNDGDEALTQLSLRISLPGFGLGASEARVERVEPGDSVQVPFVLTLAREQLRDHDENTTALLRFEVSYRQGEYTVRDELRRPVTIYHRNAMTWARVAQVASFVTATTDSIQRAARQLARQGLATGRGPLHLPVALFEGLRTMRYVPDPVNPYGSATVDYVQFPAQTLERGTGDCDDLAILYASLAEAVGLETLLVTTPGHIFVALPTDHPSPSDGVGISEKEARLMKYAGRLWIPIETSALESDFDAAWTTGARLVEAATRSRKLGVVDVRRAWTSHPPVDLSPRARGEVRSLVPVSDTLVVAADSAAERLGGELEGMLARLEQRSRAQPKDPAILNQRGVLLVALGDLEGARDLFQRSLAEGAIDAAPSNNLGNLMLLDGEASEALHYYDAAMQSAEDLHRRRIVLNRLLAAWMIDPSGPRFLELVLSAEDDDLQAFYRGVNGGPLRSTSTPTVAGGGRGYPTADIPVRKLVHWL